MLHLSCTALGQSELSNFCLYIIIFVNLEYKCFKDSVGFYKWSLFIVVYVASATYACVCKVIFAEKYSVELKDVFVFKTKRISIPIVLFISISGLHKSSVIYRRQLCQCWQCSGRQSQGWSHLVVTTDLSQFELIQSWKQPNRITACALKFCLPSEWSSVVSD